MKSSVNFARLSISDTQDFFTGRRINALPFLPISTSSASMRNSFGILTAWLLPLLNTLAVLIGRGGLYNNVLRIAPALNIGKADIEESVKILEDSFAALGVG